MYYPVLPSSMGEKGKICGGSGAEKKGGERVKRGIEE
jgi:hypothetical protein